MSREKISRQELCQAGAQPGAAGVPTRGTRRKSASTGLVFGEPDAADTKGDEAGREIAQDGNARKELELPGDVYGLLGMQHGGDEAPLHEGLQLLNGARGQFPLTLDLGEVVIGYAVGLERIDENVCGDDSILDGVVDANATDGRHHVSRVTNQEETRLVPERATIGLDREQGQLAPVDEGVRMPGELRRDFDEALPDSLDSLCTQLLIVALGEDQA